MLQVRRLYNADSGQSVIEYALVVAFVSVVIVAGLFGVVDGVIPACQALVDAVL